mgnify:CR=1 FL=1
MNLEDFIQSVIADDGLNVEKIVVFRVSDRTGSHIADIFTQPRFIRFTEEYKQSSFKLPFITTLITRGRFRTNQIQSVGQNDV